MILNKKEMEKLNDISFAEPFTVNNENYYVKKTNRYNYEMLGFILARLFEIKSPECSLVKLDNVYVFSKDLNDIGRFEIMQEITDMDSNAIKDIISTLQDIEEEQIIRMYLYDMFFQNCDRSKGNYGVIKDDLYIIDNESIFDLYDIPIVTSSDYEIMSYELTDDTYMNVVKYEISTFLLKYNDYKYIIKDILNKINPYKLKYICNGLGIENTDFVIFYTKVYNEIKNMINLNENELININESVLIDDINLDNLAKKKYS
ncbi:MAG: hypothetical protein R3Y13_04630 [bacterium]